MRIVPIITLILFFACEQPHSGGAMKFTTASEYNNYIIERQKWVANYISSFYATINRDLDSASSMLPFGIERIEKLMAEIGEMPAYRGDTLFRQAAVNSFGFYKHIFQVEYPAIIDLLNKKKAGFSELQAKAQILDRIIREEDKFDRQLHNRQRDFAERFQMKLSGKE